MFKTTVFGLPLNPRHLLNQLAGQSFCVSFAHRDRLGSQLDQAIELVGQDGILLVDNGAYTHWQQGGQMTLDYVESYEAWAAEILARCPQAIAVYPDVIGGTEEQNRKLIEESLLDWNRAMPVWHMHESLEYLLWMCESWDYVAIGSTCDKPGSPKWHARMREAFAAIDKWEQDGEGSVIRPRIHMMRAQKEAHLYPIDSVDSTNVARNHSRQLKRSGETIAMSAARVDGKLQASAGPEAEHQVKRPYLFHVQAAELDAAFRLEMELARLTAKADDRLLVDAYAKRLGYYPEHLEPEEMEDLRRAA